MKKILTYICILLVCVTVFQTSAAAAETSEIQPRFDYINAITSELSIEIETHVATCYAKIIVNGNYNIAADCKLQKLENNAWVTVHSWTESGSRILSFTEYVTVASGYRYRFTFTTTISDSTGTTLETVAKSYYYDFR